MNDTLTGDPLMTVPILTGQTNGDQVPSLCYEVHGKAEQYFNLISDTCTSVNAFYQKAENLSDNIDLNVVTKIGVRAVGGDNSTCKNIEVSLESCTVTVDGVVQGSDVYNNNGIRLRRTANANGLRVRIAVPNCARNMLVMWVFCASGRVEDPVTWEYFSASFIRFVVMRGLNLNDFSHGLIGMRIAN